MFKFEENEPILKIKKFSFFVVPAIGSFSKEVKLAIFKLVLKRYVSLVISKEITSNFDFRINWQEIVLEIRPQIFKLIILI